MPACIAHSASLNRRLRRSFAVALLAVAVLYIQISAPAQARQNRETVLPPTVRPPVVRPPRTGIEGARGYRAPLAEEREWWAKRYEELTENPPVLDKKTGKWGFKNTSETFHSRYVAEEAWKTMKIVASKLKDGKVKEAKSLWKVYNANADTRWYGRTGGRKNRELNYGTSKAGKARAKADEAAHRNVLDKLWKEVKKAEASGMKPGKSGSPVTN